MSVTGPRSNVGGRMSVGPGRRGAFGMATGSFGMARICLRVILGKCVLTAGGSNDLWGRYLKGIVFSIVVTTRHVRTRGTGFWARLQTIIRIWCGRVAPVIPAPGIRHGEKTGIGYMMVGCCRGATNTGPDVSPNGWSPSSNGGMTTGHVFSQSGCRGGSGTGDVLCPRRSDQRFASGTRLVA